MHVLIDVGNTETMVGVIEVGKLKPFRTWRYSTPVPRTPDELRLLLSGLLRDGGVDPAELDRAVVASVVPGVTDLLPTALRGLGAETVFVVDSRTRLPIRLDVEEPRTVGPDRIVNTLAATRLFERDTIVVDLGTAITYDLISHDGVFMGGVIAPGLRAGQEWLAGRTAKLPRVEFRPPSRVIGRRTEDCLESGIFYSAIDAIDGIVQRIREEWGREDVLVVGTGGYATTVAAHSRTIEVVEPHLTLIGLGIAGEHMAETGPSGLHSPQETPSETPS